MNRSASRKLLFPAPFEPTRIVSGAILIMHEGMLLQFRKLTRVIVGGLAAVDATRSGMLQ